MSFLNPLAFLGLLSLPVILYFHLMRENRRREVVSNLELWSFLDHELRGPRRRRIPLTRLLALDLAAAALLSLAWSQPRLHVALPVVDARHRVIVLDVSTSMRAREGLGTRFETARAEAVALIENAGPRDFVTVLSFGRAPHWIGDSRQDSQEALLDRLSALGAGETGHALQEALALGLAAAQSQEGPRLPVEFHVFTDGAFPLDSGAGQESEIDESGAFGLASAPGGPLDGFLYPIHWRWFSGLTENSAVLDLNVTPLSEGRYQVFARLANFGTQEVARVLSLEVDGREINTEPLMIPAGTALPRVWEITADPQRTQSVSVALSSGDSLPEDDRASAGLRQGGVVRVALVAEEGGAIERALKAVPEVELERLSPQEYAAGQEILADTGGGSGLYDLVVFHGYLPAEWPAAPALVVEPTQQSPGAAAAPLLARSGRDIPPDAPMQAPAADPLLAGIDFSGVRWSKAWTLPSIPAGFDTLLQAGDAPLLLRGGAGAGLGQVWVLLADLSRGNFTKHPAFPILIANVVAGVRHGSLPPSVSTGETIPLPAAGSGDRLTVSPPASGPADFGPGWPASWELTLDPGLYRFTVTGASGSSEFVSGANAGDRVESDLKRREWADGSLPGEAGPGSGEPAAPVDDRSIDLAPWLLAAALVVFFLEAALAWKG